MNRFLFTIMVLSFLAALTSFVVMDSRKEDKSLEGLWAEYEKASQQDLVREMAEILEEIKAAALSERAAWDYYRSCDEYVDVKSRRNWKLRAGLRRQMKSEIYAYDEPLLIYLFERNELSREELLESVSGMEERLKAGHNREVYDGNSDVAPDSAVLSLIANDYEYVLWDMFTRSFYGAQEFRDSVYGLLKEEVGDSYPKAGIAEYRYIVHSFEGEAEKSALKELAARYEGRAVSLLPYGSLMEIEFMENQGTGTSEYFINLKKRLEAAENERKSYRRGPDAMIAADYETFADLIDRLDGKAVQVVVSRGNAQLALRNLDKIRVEIAEGDETVYRTVLTNPACSFYRLDTLTMDVPSLDDGDYRIICYDGNEELGEYHYPKYTLSAASRTDKDGMGIYVAEYDSGRPVDKVDIELFEGDRRIAEARDVELNGFTYLPESIASKIEEDRSGYRLVCSMTGRDGLIRKSPEMYVRGKRSYGTGYPFKRNASVMLDRAAFNPGETVKFKAVIYDESTDGQMTPAPEGTKVVAVLIDMTTNVLAEKNLTVNEFGSVAGEFVLDVTRRGGMHNIRIRDLDGKNLGFGELIIDEFVLPTFDLTFDEPEKVALPGEKMSVTGRVSSYSGHSLASVKVEAKVIFDGNVVLDADVELDAEGRFAFGFTDSLNAADRYSPYEIEVKVTDLTGETASFFTRRYVMRRPYVDAVLENPAEGSFTLSAGDRHVGNLLSDDVAKVSLFVSHFGGELSEGIPVKYYLVKDGEKIMAGDALSGGTVEVDFSGLCSGLYEFVAEVSLADAGGRKLEDDCRMPIVKVGDGAAVPDGRLENLFFVAGVDAPELKIGAGCAPFWAVVELFGDRMQRLKSEIIYVDKGEMKTVGYEYRPEYPDFLVMNVLYFRDSRCHTFTHTWERPRGSGYLPLEIVRFDDLAAPGTSCSVVLKTKPGVEVAASVFDLASEQIHRNVWDRIVRRGAFAWTVSMRSCPGMNGSGHKGMMGEAEYMNVKAYGALRTKSVLGSVTTEDAVAEEEAIPFQLVSDPEVKLRTDFSSSLAFEPFLYPSEDGTVTMDFKTSDKLSTFVLNVFAHDKSLNNNMVRSQMVVTLPVKVSVVQPQYLYAGDRYVVRASLSNVSPSDVCGTVRLEAAASGETVVSEMAEVSLPSGSSVPMSFEIPVPEGIDGLEVKVVFSGGGVSDGVMVHVPVYPAEQKLMEAHSSVVRDGMSEQEVITMLKDRFVNVSGQDAVYSAASVMDMLRDALPLVTNAEGKDAVSQSEAMYVNLLAGGLRLSEGGQAKEYVDAAMSAASKIIGCVNSDGGIGWFEGMKSSPAVTAVVLERFAGLRDRGLLTMVHDALGEDALDAFDETVVDAVRYLDAVYFGDSGRPSWYAALTPWQYMHVRTMYTGIPFDRSAARKAAGTDAYKEFMKTVKSCLVPKKGKRLTEGAILQKVRMIRILNALTASGQGMALAQAWGITSERKMRRSMKIELASLKEYAVEHSSGGMYYPNAVLPWRGLLESEAYAHAMICDLYKELADDEELAGGLDELADGIRLWIMLQKETQQWGTDPGFIEAIASVYDGSDAVRSVKVAVLSESYVKPFEEIEPAGNGFKVSVEYYQAGSGDGFENGRRRLSEGDMLRIGDKIVARYSLWSEENRSFVRLSVPRPANLRPADQISGWAGGILRPLSYGIYSIAPYAYREVKADRTLYWIDVFPEEDSVVEETLFVTQEGVFQAPASELESLYSPHYRANDRMNILESMD